VPASTWGSEGMQGAAFCIVNISAKKVVFLVSRRKNQISRLLDPLEKLL